MYWQEMDSIIKANLPIIREEVSREEARLAVLLISYMQLELFI